MQQTLAEFAVRSRALTMNERFRTASVGAANWDDLVALFEGRGGPHYCWCMAWRAKPSHIRDAQGAQRSGMLKTLLKRRADQGVPLGLLGYYGCDPVGWVSVAPRNSYRPMGGVRIPGLPDSAVWSIACFYVQAAYRGRGLSRRLASAAAEYARTNGADLVEAYPADDDSPSYGFMGRSRMFLHLGFEPVGRAGSRRTVMRRALNAEEPIAWP